MAEDVLLPTAYLPPAAYFSLIAEAKRILIEKQENYAKQTYRNRCTILTANGRVNLTVPVKKGGSLKTVIRDAAIDYSKRWQQVHLGAISSAYGRSPYFLYYYPDFEKIITARNKFLIDLNNELLTKCLSILRLVTPVSFTDSFINPGKAENDFRYSPLPEVNIEPYIQVFPSSGSAGELSIIDLIFNTGPEAGGFVSKP